MFSVSVGLAAGCQRLWTLWVWTPSWRPVVMSPRWMSALRACIVTTTGPSGATADQAVKVQVNGWEALRPW